MANQMIALQARNPQLPDPSRAAAQYANMMNMASQQRASQLQSERTRQEMDYARASEARDKQTQTATMRDKDLDFQLKDMKRLRNIGVAVLQSGNEDAYQSLLGMIDQSDPQFGATIRQVAPTFNANVLQTILMEADKYIDKTVATPTASLELGVDGTPRSVQVGGLAGTASQSPVYDAIETPVVTPASSAAAPRTPAGAPMRATQGANTTPRDLMLQGMDPRNIPSGMPTARPLSFNQSDMGAAGQMSPDMVPAILDSAINTGVMAQIDLDQMLAMTPPQARQGIMDVIRNSNISLQADAPSLAASGMGQQQPMAPNPVGRQQSQFANLRGPTPQASFADLGGQPEMRNVMAQTQPRTITRLQQRNPNVSPLPGSASVPLSRVAGEAEARRETRAQITARKNAELAATEAFEETNKGARLSRKREEVFAGERAKKDSDFLESYNDAVTKGRTTLNVIDQMIGDAKIEKGSLVVPKGGRRPHPGFEGVVGMGVPGVRFIPGTQAASFDALFRQAEGGAFLQAYESLRGTGQITEIEGSKATSALTRMERSQTEVEFVKAAREFADVIRGAVARSDKRYTALTGEAPPAAATQRKTPTSKLTPATRAKYGL
jgi:hypothetical protein